MTYTKSNPTIRSQKKVLAILQKSDSYMTIAEISDKAGLQHYQTLAIVDFFDKLKLLHVVRSSGGITMISLNNEGSNGKN